MYGVSDGMLPIFPSYFLSRTHTLLSGSISDASVPHFRICFDSVNRHAFDQKEHQLEQITKSSHVKYFTECWVLSGNEVTGVSSILKVMESFCGQG